MKPQEKALELFSIYRFALSLPGAPLGEEKDNVAKQCTLICVEQILERNQPVQGHFWSYWEQVKQEIEKL